MIDYDTIAYKVEDGVITNATVVDPSAPVEEGFVKRPYYLKIGFVSKFGDYYDTNITQKIVNTFKEDQQTTIDNMISANQGLILAIESYLANLGNANTDNVVVQTANTSSTGESSNTEVALVSPIPGIPYYSDNEKYYAVMNKLKDYQKYLEGYMDNLMNPVYQSVKPFEEF